MSEKHNAKGSVPRQVAEQREVFFTTGKYWKERPNLVRFSSDVRITISLSLWFIYLPLIQTVRSASISYDRAGKLHLESCSVDLPS